MSKIEELYKFHESFPDILSTELLKEKEEALLQEEFAPMVRQSVSQIFSGVRSPISISIDYEPEGDVVVKISRKRDSVPSMRVRHPALLDDPMLVPEKVRRSESKGFTVYFKDGTMVQRKNAKETMIATLKVIGLRRVAAFRGRLFKGIPFVSRNRRTDVDFKCQELIDGWFVYTNMSNDTKIEILRQISDELNLGLIIKDEMGNVVSSSYAKSDMTKKPAKRTLYKLNGEGPYSKRELVLLVVTQYQMEHPDFTFEQIERAFPKNLQGSYGVVRPLSWIKEKAELGSDHLNRYYTEEKDLLTSADGIKFAVCNQWGDNFSNFTQQVEKLGWKISEE